MPPSEVEPAAVVVIGGGFGGLNTALQLASSAEHPSVVLLEPREHFLFLPLLYELLSAEQFVEQGQKEKVLAGLEQHHRRVLCGGRQLQSGIETTEATADHHNSCGLNLGWGHGRRWRRRPGRTLTISPHIGRWCDDNVCFPLRTQLRSAAGL